MQLASQTASEAAPSEHRDPRRVFKLLAAGALVLTAALYFVRLGARALWSMEFRWAEIAREMLVTHHYFWPTINGVVYYDKPLGSYWLVLASTWITGRLDETAARIPCAVAGLIAVALLILLVRRLYDWRSAALAGFALATSFSFVFFSRAASADVETITGEIAALLLFTRYEDRQDGWWVVGLWLIMAATSLTKGLLGFVLPIMVIGLYCVLAEGWREFGARLGRGAIAARVGWIIRRNRWLFNWKSIVAIAVGVAFYYWPFLISRDVTGSSKGVQEVFRENVVRFFHPFDHRGPVYLYTYWVFILAMPWALFLPAALIQAHYDRGRRAPHAHADRFTLIYFWATFAFYTASGSRRSYYILPIVPAVAILVARLLTRPRAELTLWARRLLILAWALIAATVVIGFIGLIPPAAVLPGRWKALPPAPDRIILAIFLIASLIAVIAAIVRFSRTRVVVSLCIVAYLAMFYIFVFAMPAADAWRGEKPFALRVLKDLGPQTASLALFKTKGPLFYLNLPAPLPEFDRGPSLDRAIEAGKVRYVIVRRRDMAAMGTTGRIIDAERSFRFEDKRDYRNKVVLIQVGS